MKRLLTLAFMFACSTLIWAQHFIQGPLHSSDNPREDWILPGDTIVNGAEKLVYNGKPRQLNPVGEVKLKNPTDEKSSRHEQEKMPEAVESYAWGLHEGLNASVGLSAFATFGKHVPHHGGFTQDINATYLAPITRDRKMWLAAGGYLQNTFWGGDSYRDAGLYAILGYRFDEHWEAYVYGQLSLANNYAAYYDRYGWYGHGLFGGRGYGMGMAGANVLGAGVIYHVNRSLSIGIDIQGAWYDDPTPSFNNRYKYDYPLNDRNP